jgi:hypothetical protein
MRGKNSFLRGEAADGARSWLTQPFPGRFFLIGRNMARLSGIAEADASVNFLQ